MKKTPKWLIPAISIVVALAVGIAAVIFSGRFAPADRVETNIEAGTETTTLYGPSGYGDDDVVDLPADALPASPEVGTIEVSNPLPDDPDVTPLEDAVDRIAEGGAAGDDIPTIIEDESGAGAGAVEEPSTPAEDPCIAADDCPEGTVSGRIFALTAPPEYLLRARAFPDEAMCPVAPTGSVSLMVFMTRPSDITVTVERVDGGGRVGQYEGSTPFDVALIWNHLLPDAESVLDLPLLYLCFTMTDIEPGVLYRAIANGESQDGASTSTSTEFNGAGPTHHPTLSLEPVGDGAVVAYTEHRPDEQVAIRAWVMPADFTGTPDCFGTHAGETELDWTYRRSSDLTAEVIGNLLIPAENTKRHAVSFLVPEGSQIVFCATWHPGTEAPSWERVQSSYFDGAILRTTDYVLPRVTLVRVDLNPLLSIGITEVGVFGRTQEGMNCGGLRFDPENEVASLPAVICDLEGIGADFDLPSWGYRDNGFTGNIVISAELRNADGDGVTRRGTLNIGDMVCMGVCDSNPTTRYTVPLGSFGTILAGHATVLVSWEQGNTNGLVRPVVSDLPVRGEVIDGVLPWATPMMDTDERISYDRIDAATLSGVAALRLVTDRPVDYTVTLSGLRGEECSVGGAVLEATGRSEGETDVEISGLCLGHFYWATVRLVDEFGGSTTFSYNRGGVTQWYASLVSVPKVEVNLHYSYTADIPDDQAILPSSIIQLDGVLIPMPDRTCVSGTLADSGVITVPMTSHPVFKVDVAVSPVNTGDGVHCTHLGEDIISITNTTIVLDLVSLVNASGPTTIEFDGMVFVFTVLE
jgi:hypothetical protein